MRFSIAVAALVAALTSVAFARSTPPDVQTAFVAAVEQHRDAYRSAQGDLRKALARTERGKRLAEILKPTKGVVKDWVGTIRTLKTTEDGNAYITITLSRRLAFQTWNSSAADTISQDNTLIAQSSPLFKVMADLKAGDQVVFSAVLKPDPKDGWHEVSLTEDGGMTDPSFLFRLTGIKKAP